MGGEEREKENSAYYQVLVDRCRSLEEKQAKLKEQFDELVQQGKKKFTVVRKKNNEEAIFADSTAGFFFSPSYYASVLNCMGHAVHVHRISSGEIIYW